MSEKLFGYPVVQVDKPEQKTPEIVLGSINDLPLLKVRITPETAAQLLEVSRHDHERGGQEGLDACWATYQTNPGPCDCGADEANERIDLVIKWLRAQ